MVGSISVQDLKARLDAGEAVHVLDVRFDVEVRAARLLHENATGFTHIPLPELPGRFAELSLAPGATLIALCHHGMRSYRAAAWLAGHGVTALNLEGGIDAWSAHIDPDVPRYHF